MAVGAWQVGAVKLRSNLVLSPMSGITDSAFRRMVRQCSGHDVGLLVSEFIAAEGLSRDNAKTLRMLRFHPNERPISIQIFGADIDRMVTAAQMVEDTGADIIDINCGCPAPKVVKRGGGAQLLRTPERIAALVRAVVKATSIPVTVKIRSGWDETTINAEDVAMRIEDAGAAMVAIHGRTRVQLYSGRADWEIVRALRGRLRIPVVGSGDIASPVDAITHLVRDADAVMIGRAALSNPWIFAQAAAISAGRAMRVVIGADLITALGMFRDAMRETYPDHSFIGRYRGLACHFLKGMRGSASVRATIGNAATVATIDDIFATFVHGLSAECRPWAAVA